MPSHASLSLPCSIIVYFALGVAALGAWHLLSDGDFSFLMVRRG
jgi:hypothetical protein